MRLLLAVSALLSLASCVGADDPGKLDSSDTADSVPLVADVEYGSSMDLRCADPEDGEVCYYSRLKRELDVEPGERFTGGGAPECILGDEPALYLYVAPVTDSDDDGVLQFNYDIYFDCGSVIPEVGDTFEDEIYTVGNMGTVVRIYVTGEYDPD